MANNRCQMCGKELPEDVLNCIYCGARLVPKEGLKNSNSIVLKPQNDTDEFIDSLFSDDEQDTKSPSEDLKNEISNI